MKYVVTLLIAVAAFFAGRYSVPVDVQPLPSLPIAFVQATQPVALTIDVDLTTRDAARTARTEVHQLNGSAKYQFTNLTDKTVSIAFPPTRTFSISSSSLGHDSQPCPAALSTKQVMDIPANSSKSLWGPWSTTVTGDLDSYLQAGAGRHGFTFSACADTECFNGTLIAFQSFNGVSPKNQFHTTDGHLGLVTTTRTP